MLHEITICSSGVKSDFFLIKKDLAYMLFLELRIFQSNSAYTNLMLCVTPLRRVFCLNFRIQVL